MAAAEDKQMPKTSSIRSPPHYHEEVRTIPVIRHDRFVIAKAASDNDAFFTPIPRGTMYCICLEVFHSSLSLSPGHHGHDEVNIR